MAQSTNDSVEAFKTFVRKHPELAKGIKKEGKSWKEVFEEWVIFGEDHEIWENYGIQHGNSKSSKKQNEMVGKILSYIKNADADTIGKQLTQLNGALGTIQELLVQFQPSRSNNNNGNTNTNPMNAPFNGNGGGLQPPNLFQQPQQPQGIQQQQGMQPQQPNGFGQPFPFRRD